MNKIKRFRTVLAFGAAALAGTTAVAVPPYPDLQTNAPDIYSRTPRYSPQRPTVSPYISLAPNSLNLSAVRYYTLVQPLIDQQQINQRQGAELGQLEHRIQQNQAATELLEQNFDDEGNLVARKRAVAGYMTHRKYFGLQKVTPGAADSATGR